MYINVDRRAQSSHDGFCGVKSISSKLLLCSGDVLAQLVTVRLALSEQELLVLAKSVRQNIGLSAIASPAWGPLWIKNTTSELLSKDDICTLLF
jgi:hypothetical protein